MALDPSIILGVKPPTVAAPNPLDTLQAITQIQGLREQTEQRRLAADKARQTAADEAAFRNVMTQTGGDVDQALPLLRQINPRAAMDFQTNLGKQREAEFKGLKEKMEFTTKQFEVGDRLLAYAHDDPSFQVVRPMIAQISPDIATQLGDTYDPVKVQGVRAMAQSAKERHDQEQEGLKLITDGKLVQGINTVFATADTPEKWAGYQQMATKFGVPPAILDAIGPYSPENVTRAQTNAITPEKQAELAGQAQTRAAQAARDAAAAHSPAYKEWQDYQATGGTLGFDEYQTRDANRKAAHIRVTTGQGSADDIKEAVQCMIDGKCPPQLPGRASTNYTATMAEAQRRGYNLAGAATDWAATQKHIATMNGAQQLRLNQAVNALPEMLDKVDTLAQQWNGGRFAILNRANLAAAKGGVYGPKAATIATQLDAQIADVVADLGNVYMGGNSPTDHALGLASKSLQADWSEPVLRQMITLAKQNVQIRRNSINNTGVAGASADNPYLPQAAAPTAPPTDPLTVTTPTGKTYTFKSAAEAAAFKARAGIR